MAAIRLNGLLILLVSDSTVYAFGFGTVSYLKSKKYKPCK